MTRNLAWRAPITIILAVASVAFLALALRTFLLPATAAAYYGVATDMPEALVFVKAYGARNIAISLSVMAFLWLDQRKALVVLLAGAALVAALDASIMFGQSGLAGAVKHIAYAGGLSGLAAATYRLNAS